MKTKSNHELFFEFQGYFDGLCQFAKVRTSRSILDEIDKIAKAYIDKNKSLFIENETVRLSFDKFMRCIKYPYRYYADETKFDKGAVRYNLTQSFSDAIIELNITISDKQNAIFETNKLYSERPNIEQQKINF